MPGRPAENGRHALCVRLAAILPAALFAYPFCGLLLARSEVPLVLGRYSPFLAAVLLVSAAALAVAITGAWANRPALSQAALLAMALISFVIPGSNAAQRLPFVQYVLPMLRMICAVALILALLLQWRQRRRSPGPLLGIGAVLGMLSVADLSLAMAARERPPHAASLDTGFRAQHDLDAPPSDAVVLIGDSFVWGQGVAPHETFGADLERLFASAGVERPVYNLGIIGSNPSTYARVLERIPATQSVERVVMAYYMNDMPPVSRLADGLRNQLIALGVGSPSLRLLGDLLAKAATPTVQAYNAAIVASYDPQDETFEARWRILETQLARFERLARARSRKPPVMLILPLMVDFRRYPLEHAHRGLTRLGHELGFEVIDLLPVFRERLVDGSRYVVAPNDNHFDARAHALVAETLREALD